MSRRPTEVRGSQAAVASAKAHAEPAAGPASAGADRVPPSARLIAIGMVMGTHGVRGDLRVKVYNEDSEILASLDAITVRQGGTTSVHKIRSAQPATKGWLVRLAGVETLEAARLVHKAEVCVPRAALPALEPGEFYFADLEGLYAQTRDGTRVGEVLSVREYPASSVLLVRLPTGVVEVPMTEPYLVSVDVEVGHVVIDHLDELEVETPRQ